MSCTTASSFTAASRSRRSSSRARKTRTTSGSAPSTWRATSPGRVPTITSDSIDPTASRFSAPDLVRTGEASPQSDIFSLGAGLRGAVHRTAAVPVRRRGAAPLRGPADVHRRSTRPAGDHRPRAADALTLDPSDAPAPPRTWPIDLESRPRGSPIEPKRTPRPRPRPRSARHLRAGQAAARARRDRDDLERVDTSRPTTPGRAEDRRGRTTPPTSPGRGPVSSARSPTPTWSGSTTSSRSRTATSSCSSSSKASRRRCGPRPVIRSIPAGSSPWPVACSARSARCTRPGGSTATSSPTTSCSPSTRGEADVDRRRHRLSHRPGGRSRRRQHPLQRSAGVRGQPVGTDERPVRRRRWCSTSCSPARTRSAAPGRRPPATPSSSTSCLTRWTTTRSAITRIVHPRRGARERTVAGRRGSARDAATAIQTLEEAVGLSAPARPDRGTKPAPPTAATPALLPASAKLGTSIATLELSPARKARSRASASRSSAELDRLRSSVRARVAQRGIEDDPRADRACDRGGGALARTGHAGASSDGAVLPGALGRRASTRRARSGAHACDQGCAGRAWRVLDRRPRLDAARRARSVPHDRAHQARAGPCGAATAGGA